MPRHRRCGRRARGRFPGRRVRASSTSSAWDACATPKRPPIRAAAMAGPRRAKRRASSRCGWRSTTSCASPTSRDARAATRACGARRARAKAMSCASPTTSSPACRNSPGMLPRSLADRLLAWDRRRGGARARAVRDADDAAQRRDRRDGRAARAGRAARLASPRHALRRRAGRDRALARRDRARSRARTGRSATRSRWPGGSSRATARPTCAASATSRTSSTTWRRRNVRVAGQRARAIREAREAALADEGGRGLDAALVRHGAPARPVVAQPIRFVRKARESLR